MYVRQVYNGRQRLHNETTTLAGHTAPTPARQNGALPSPTAHGQQHRLSLWRKSVANGSRVTAVGVDRAVLAAGAIWLAQLWYGRCGIRRLPLFVWMIAVVRPSRRVSYARCHLDPTAGWTCCGVSADFREGSLCVSASEPAG